MIASLNVLGITRLSTGINFKSCCCDDPAIGSEELLCMGKEWKEGLWCKGNSGWDFCSDTLTDLFVPLIDVFEGSVFFKLNKWN